METGSWAREGDRSGSLCLAFFGKNRSDERPKCTKQQGAGSCRQQKRIFARQKEGLQCVVSRQERLQGREGGRERVEVKQEG